MSTQELVGRTALVTGATSGIGRATALALAGLGARVLVAGRDEQRGEQVVKDIGAAGGTAVFLQASLDDAESARQLARRADLAAGGQVDILVNNAGAGAFAPTRGFPEDTAPWPPNHAAPPGSATTASSSPTATPASAPTHR